MHECHGGCISRLCESDAVAPTPDSAKTRHLTRAQIVELVIGTHGVSLRSWEFCSGMWHAGLCFVLEVDGAKAEGRRWIL